MTECHHVEGMFQESLNREHAACFPSCRYHTSAGKVKEHPIVLNSLIYCRLLIFIIITEHIERHEMNRFNKLNYLANCSQMSSSVVMEISVFYIRLCVLLGFSCSEHRYL